MTSRRCRQGDDQAAGKAATVLAGILSADHAPAEAQRLLRKVVEAGFRPEDHPFIRNYLSRYQLNIGIAPGITAQLPINRDLVVLLYAELRQRQGDLQGAIQAVKELDPTTYAAVSLAELYVEAARFDEVIEVSEGVVNQDDSTALLLVYRAAALRRLKMLSGARELLGEVTRTRSRAAVIRHTAYLERARFQFARSFDRQAIRNPPTSRLDSTFRPAM